MAKPSYMKVYKRAKNSKGYSNLKNKNQSTILSKSKLGTFTITQSKRDLRREDF
jgi:hypothetical protein